LNSKSNQALTSKQNPKSKSRKVIHWLTTLLLSLTVGLGSIFITPALGQVLPPGSQDNSTDYINYRVRSGETLGGLAERFGCSVAGIKTRTGLTSDLINVGQIIKIPANYIKYTVRPGDTLWGIANKHGTTIAKITLFNNLTTTALYPGQIIRVPHVSTLPRVTFITHIVRSGDTPWIISLKYGIPHPELLKVNGLSLASTLSLGQSLRIPVYSIPVQPTPGPQFGEYLDWWTEAEYLFPIGKIAKVRDFVTGRVYTVKRTIGAFHADCEPLTATDAAIMKSLWGGAYSWVPRSVVITVDNRKIAASIASMPHGIQYIDNNNFNGHFDMHFKNSTRHKDNAIDPGHQAKIRISAGR
jgi:peptidoglycan DL-endopeptidase LytF